MVKLGWLCTWTPPCRVRCILVSGYFYSMSNWYLTSFPEFYVYSANHGCTVQSQMRLHWLMHKQKLWSYLLDTWWLPPGKSRNLRVWIKELTCITWWIWKYPIKDQTLTILSVVRYYIRPCYRLYNSTVSQYMYWSSIISRNFFQWTGLLVPYVCQNVSYNPPHTILTSKTKWSSLGLWWIDLGCLHLSMQPHAPPLCWRWSFTIWRMH